MDNNEQFLKIKEDFERIDKQKPQIPPTTTTNSQLKQPPMSTINFTKPTLTNETKNQTQTNENEFKKSEVLSLNDVLISSSSSDESNSSSSNSSSSSDGDSSSSSSSSSSDDDDSSSSSSSSDSDSSSSSRKSKTNVNSNQKSTKASKSSSKIVVDPSLTQPIVLQPPKLIKDNNILVINPGETLFCLIRKICFHQLKESLLLNNHLYCF